MIMNWFEVDKEGLARLVERRGKVFILHELLQNAWDCANVTRVDVRLTPIENKPYAELEVTDDNPDGFRDLSHAYTLFAESEKKGKADKRGRFKLGEKLVLSLCEEATITSTRGIVRFTKEGRRERRGLMRTSGSSFHAIIRMTRAELDDVLSEIRKIAPPTGTKTFINERQVQPRLSVKDFLAVLRTEVASAGGPFNRPHRETIVSLYGLRQGERATLFEMGIPVMELGDDPFHVDVQQKIPMGMERESVTSTWLKELRGAVLDHAHQLLTEESARGRWVGDAIEEASSSDSVRAIIDKRFGKKTVIADPSDREGENIAKSQGYTVIPGGSFSAEAWEKIRQTKAALPAGQVTPSPKPFHPGGDPLKIVPRKDWTPLMHDFEEFATWFAKEAAYLSIDVSFTYDPDWSFEAAYTKKPGNAGHVIFNLAKLDRVGFLRDRESQVMLLIHELGHHCGGHLDASYHESLCAIGARIATLAVQHPQCFSVLV